MCPDPSQAKERLRRLIRARRAAQTSREHAAAGVAVAIRLLRDVDLARRERWALYASLPDELSTRPLFDLLRARGRVTLLPRIRGPQLEFARVREWGDLRGGPHGILQPPVATPESRLRPDDVVVLPGLAFDPGGHRLGRGRGYYDRAFGAFGGSPLRIGVGHAWQILERVPHDSRDRRVDAIVTEHQFLWPRGRR